MTGYLTTDQAAARLGLSNRRVRDLIRAGRLPRVAVSPRVLLIPESAVESFERRPPGRPAKKKED